MSMMILGNDDTRHFKQHQYIPNFRDEKARSIRSARYRTPRPFPSEVTVRLPLRDPTGPASAPVTSLPGAISKTFLQFSTNIKSEIMLEFVKYTCRDRRKELCLSYQAVEQTLNITFVIPMNLHSYLR